MNNTPKPDRKTQPTSQVQQDGQRTAPGDVEPTFPGWVTGQGSGGPGQALTSAQAGPGGDIEADAPPVGPNGSPARKPNRGRFQPGQPGPRLESGRYSDQHLPPGLADWLPGEVARFMGAQLIDEGVGEVDIPPRRRALLGYRASVHKNILKMSFALDEKGLVDRKGKLRTSWLQMLMSLMDRAVRLDGLLGLERTPKQIPQSPREWLESLADVSGNPDTNTDK